MENTPEPILATWRREGPAILAQRRAEYDRLLENARLLLARHRHRQGAAALQAAANYAVLWHTGQFTDPRIEAMLRQLGRQALHDDRPCRPPRRSVPWRPSIPTPSGNPSGVPRSAWSPPT